MVQRLHLALAGIAFLAAPVVAHAQCAIVDPVVVPEIRVDPLDASGPGELVQPLTLTFRRAGVDGEPMMVRYQIVDEDSSVQSRVGLSQGPTLEWQGSDSSRDIGAFRSEAYALLRSSRAVFGPDVQAVQERVLLRLTNLRADLAAGVYREQFTIRYWCGEGDVSMPYEAPATIAVAVAVPNVLSANIAGASLHGEIDFLNFEMPTRSLQIGVRSTGPFAVTARSLNGGEMRRENGTGQASERIRYNARFGGEALDLAGGGGMRLDRAGLSGRQIPLDVSVESVESKRAGNYADTLLLTLSPAN